MKLNRPPRTRARTKFPNGWPDCRKRWWPSTARISAWARWYLPRAQSPKIALARQRAGRRQGQWYGPGDLACLHAPRPAPVGAPFPIHVQATQAGTIGWLIAIAAGIVPSAAWIARRVFPVSAWTGEREETDIRVHEQPVTCSSSRRRPRNGVARAGRFEGERLLTEGTSLTQAGRPAPASSDPSACGNRGRAARNDGVNESRGRCRHEHLAPMPGGRDATRSMHIHADIALFREQRSARVDPNPYRPESPAFQGRRPSAAASSA